jgi:hypothetical protein
MILTGYKAAMEAGDVAVSRHHNVTLLWLAT